MSENNPPNHEKEGFLFPRASFRGEFTPENLVFNANLQEFAHKINYVCNLETSGKISANQAYAQIKTLWKELKASVKNMNIENNQ